MKKVLFLLIITLLVSFTNIYSEKLIGNNYKEQQNLLCKNEKKVNTIYDPLIHYSTPGHYYNDSTTYLNNYYSTIYFNNLTNNFGINKVGSCGYIAIGMYLSYLDTYWDDDIISENYDYITLLSNNAITTSTESPGIYRETSTLPSGVINATTYAQIIEQYYTYYFHYYLLHLGYLQFGYYNFENTYFPAGLTDGEIVSLIEYYMGERGYSLSDYSCSSIKSDQRSYVINKVTQGIPVLACLSSSNGSYAHSVIIYDYDANNDELYAHFGWDDIHTHIALSTTPYTMITAAITIELNTTHNCSNNYKYINGYNNYNEYCSCYFNIHSQHSHNTYYNYIPFNEIYHKKVCVCGNSVFQPHVVDSSTIQPGNLYATCILCGGNAMVGFIIIENTNPIILPNGVIVINMDTYNKMNNYSDLSLDSVYLYQFKRKNMILNKKEESI